MSQRIEKINELLRRKLSELILKEIELPDNALVTITKVETSPDIKYSKIFITVLPDQYRGTALEILNTNSKNLQQILKKQMTTKFTPNLNFQIDKQEIFAQGVEKLLDEIR
jgi:ribosome-binding factor A